MTINIKDLTTIACDDFHDLSICWDTGDNNEKCACLTFTPNMDNVDCHYHLLASKLDLIRLKEWIEEFSK